MRKSVKTLLIAVLVLCLCTVSFLVTGCQPAVDESKTLRIWSAPPLMGEGYESTLKIDPSSYSAKYTKFVYEKFKELYPDVTIAYESKGWAESLNENIVRSANVTQPDIIGTETYTQNLINMNYLADVEWSEEIYNNFIPATIETSTRDGKLYATPIYTNNFTFIYNENMLKAAGCPTRINPETLETEVIPPATWAETLYCCQKVTDYFKSQGLLGSEFNKTLYGAYVINNERGIAAGFRGELYAQMAGGSFIKEGALSNSVTAANVNFNSQENVNAMKVMRKLYGYAPVNSYLMTESEIASSLAAGRIAMTTEIAAFLTVPTLNGVVLKTAPIPVFTDGDNTTPYAYSANNRDGVNNGCNKLPTANVAVGNVSYAITRSSTKKEMAMDFIKICLSEEAQAFLLELDYRAPSTKSGMAYIMNDDNVNSQTIANRNLILDSLVDIQNSYIGEVGLSKMVGGVACFKSNISNVWIEYEKCMKKVYTQTTDIKQALDDLQVSVVNYLD